MSVGASTASTAFGSPTFSLGPVKVQYLDYTAVSGDTTCVATATGLSRVDYAMLHGVAQTAAITYSGNTATFTFTDPAATRYCQIVCYGR